MPRAARAGPALPAHAARAESASRRTVHASRPRQRARATKPPAGTPAATCRATGLPVPGPAAPRAARVRPARPAPSAPSPPRGEHASRPRQRVRAARPPVRPLAVTCRAAGPPAPSPPCPEPLVRGPPGLRRPRRVRRAANRPRQPARAARPPAGTPRSNPPRHWTARAGPRRAAEPLVPGPPGLRRPRRVRRAANRPRQPARAAKPPAGTPRSNPPRHRAAAPGPSRLHRSCGRSSSASRPRSSPAARNFTNLRDN
jgi:hypothetical protein